MEIQLQELIEQIKKDGVEAAEAQAEAILSSAKAEAEKILEEAKQEAKGMRKEALLEAKEEVDIQISNLEKKSAHQEDLIHLIDPTFSTHAPTKEAQKTTVMKSRKIFALGLIIMIVGLTLDFDYQHEAIANTLTILSFAVIFFTMAYKERYAVRIEQLNEQLYSIDQKLIAKLKEQVDALQKL